MWSAKYVWKWKLLLIGDAIEISVSVSYSHSSVYLSSFFSWLLSWLLLSAEISTGPHWGESQASGGGPHCGQTRNRLFLSIYPVFFLSSACLCVSRLRFQHDRWSVPPPISASQNSTEKRNLSLVSDQMLKLSSRRLVVCDSLIRL